MNSTSRWGAIRRGIRKRGREIALVTALLLINYLIFSRLLLMVSENRRPSPTPTRTAKPTFTPFDVVVATPTLAPEPTATEEPSPVATEGQRIHVVQEGETLSEIARDYGVTAEELAQANGLDNPNAIRVGQALVIP